MENWNMTPAEQKQHSERTRLGDNCITAQNKVAKAETELAESNNMINTWRSKKQKYQTELEILTAKDPDTLNYDLRIRKIDLEKDSAELDGFISRNLKMQETMKHSIEILGIDLTSSRSAYYDFTSVSDSEITQSQMQEMKSIPKSSPQMTEERRMGIVNKMGMDFYQNEVPMV